MVSAYPSLGAPVYAPSMQYGMPSHPSLGYGAAPYGGYGGLPTAAPKPAAPATAGGLDVFF